MKAIEAITIWIKGETKTAELFSLRSTGDDLDTTAEFYYELLDAVVDMDPVVIAQGNLSIAGTDYTTWKASTNTNVYAYTWAADQLNLIIIP